MISNDIGVTASTIWLIIERWWVFAWVRGLMLRIRTQLKAVMSRGLIITESMQTTIIEDDVVITTCSIPCIGNILGVVSSVNW